VDESRRALLSCHDKAGVAAIMEAVRAYHESGEPHGPVELLFTVGEDVGHIGSKAFDVAPVRSRMAFIADVDGPVGAVILASPWSETLVVTFRGRAAHAAAAPQAGRNALDGAVLGYVAAAALRQHIGSDERFHGIFTDGGQKPNIVPTFAETNWYVRSPTVARLEVLKERLADCLGSGAVAAGVDVELAWADYYFAEVRSNRPLLELWNSNATALGRSPQPPVPGRTVVGSTDMGNVSQVVPSIHPMIAVAPPEVAIHTEDFAACARGPDGDRGVIDGAKALAAVAIDYWSDPSVRAAVSADFSGGAGAAAASN